MELTPQEQIVKLFKEKEKILLVTHAKPDGDAISSILSMFLILEKLGKNNVNAVCADRVPEIFEFLPGQKSLKQRTIFAKDFIISLDCTRVSVEKLKWNTEDDKLNIIIKPKGGNFGEENVSFAQKKENFDLIVSVDAADKEQLGKLFSENTELFSSTTIINIDHHISNTNFGNVNLIDGTASSTTEVIFSLIEHLEKGGDIKILDENIATLLLTGIITDTGSFQNPNTTPKSFEVAAELIEHGARQQEIIRRLFKTKSLSTLKLWGSVLSRIQNDPIHRFVWSTVSANQLKEIGATSDELVGILDDLLSNAPGAEVVLLIKEREDGIISGSIRTTTNAVDAIAIAKMFGGGGHRQAAGFKVTNSSKTFEAVAAEIIEKIKDHQAKRLGLIEEEKDETKKEKTALKDIPKKKVTKKPAEEKVLEFQENKKPTKNEVNITSTLKENKEINAKESEKKLNNEKKAPIKPKSNMPKKNINQAPKKKPLAKKPIINTPKQVSQQPKQQAAPKKPEVNEAQKTKEAAEIFEKAKSELSKDFSPDELSKKVTPKKEEQNQAPKPQNPPSQSTQTPQNNPQATKETPVKNNNENEAPEWLKK